MQRHSVATLALAASTLCFAQQKMDLQLRSYVQHHRGNGEMLDLVVRGDGRCVAEAVAHEGGLVKLSSRDLLSVRVPVDAVERLAARTCVRGFEFSMEHGTTLNDSARYKSRIDLVQQGLAPLPMPYNGEGVLVGIIDTGSDFRHGDFKLNDGRTRVLKYWDHYCSTDVNLIPAAYGYGQEFDSAMINAGTFPICPPNLDHQFGHGTTVMGAAASNGNATPAGNYIGGAPASDLIVVASKLTLPNWRATIADAVKYILDAADLLRRPVAINLSLGSYTGSHDGKDAVALFIDSMLTAAPGRILVCAGGNSGLYAPYHLRTEVTADTSFTWFESEINTVLAAAGVYFDLWADSADFVNVQYAMGADQVLPSLQFRGSTPFQPLYLDSLLIDTLKSVDNNRLGIVNYYATMRGQQVYMQVAILNPDSAECLFRFRTTGSGAFDLWSTSLFGYSDIVSDIPLPADFPDIIHYVLPDSRKHIVDSWACSPNVVTVGNYQNEVTYVAANDSLVFLGGIEGSLTPTSSAGPTRDDRVKPDVAAPGDVSLSAAPPALITAYLASPTNIYKLSSDSLHLRNGGTSMASPVVTGAVALYLQKCPGAYPADVIAALTATAAGDPFTGTLPNDYWGYGKLDAFEAMISTNFTIGPLTPLGANPFCPGDSSAVAAPAGMSAWWWSDGDTGEIGYANDAGPYYVEVWNGGGCVAHSDTVVFTLHPAPAVPVITQVGYTLESTLADGYQWFLDGSAIGGANAQTYDVTITGTYAVLTTDANGCTAMSDTLFVVAMGVGGNDDDPSDMSYWPSPATDQLFVLLPASGSTADFTYSITDASGRIVREGSASHARTPLTLDVKGLAAGAYTLRVSQGSDTRSGRFLMR